MILLGFVARAQLDRIIMPASARAMLSFHETELCRASVGDVHRGDQPALDCAWGKGLTKSARYQQSRRQTDHGAAWTCR